MSEVTKKTIFAKRFNGDTAEQRRCGLFALAGVNPGAIESDGVEVFRVNKKRCRLWFRRIVLPDGVDQWSERVPDGTTCAHGEPHEMVTRDSVWVKWSEVKA